MAGFLKRLLGSDQHPGDIAAGDWSPVPAYSAASAGLASLLDDPPVPRSRPRPRPGPSPRQRRRSLRFMRFLSSEERAIVEQQRTAPPPLGPPNGSSSPRLKVAPAGAADWIDVLKSYGEHLTDDEVAIIRRQLKG